MRRCFLAIPVSPDVSSMAAKWMRGIRSEGLDVKWVEPEHLHLTLKFFGDLNDRSLFEISRAMGKVAAECESFAVEVCGLGAFPSSERPRTIWAGIRDGQEELLGLQRTLDSKLEALGFSREKRRFQPHLTLGRVRGEADFGELPEQLRKAAEVPLGTMEIEELLLYSSELHRHGPEYTRLASADLR